MYQATAPRLAPVRRDPAQFDEQLAFIARRLRFSVADLTAAERSLLDEYGRGASRDGEARYRLVTFRRLCAIAHRSRKIEDCDALPELVREEILAGAAPMEVDIAFDAETGSTGPADVEQRAFERNQNPITWQRCRDALARQLATTRAALDAVLNWKGIAP